MHDEQNIEAEIQSKGLNAPRLTPEHIDSKIVNVGYYVFPGTTMTICAIMLKNGFIVTGESAAASPENFDQEIGEKIAFDNARNKIWALEGYLLREALAFQATMGTEGMAELTETLQRRTTAHQDEQSVDLGEQEGKLTGGDYHDKPLTFD